VSFRLRIFLLVMLTTVVAIGATAWLTLSLTARELDRSQHTADQASADIATTITTYGLTHGEWSGIDRVTEQLSRQNNLHIQVKTEFGVTLADSDTIRSGACGPGRCSPRPASSTPGRTSTRRPPRPPAPRMAPRWRPSCSSAGGTRSIRPTCSARRRPTPSWGRRSR
jgi:hypothetical protein